MPTIPWAKGFPGGVTVCDAEGVILEMNDRAAETFEKYGGRALVGTNLLDCHPEPARSKLQQLLTSHQVNAYTIDQEGVKRLIYQAPWYEDGEYRGLVELSLVLPDPLPHFIRSETGVRIAFRGEKQF